MSKEWKPEMLETFFIWLKAKTDKGLKEIEEWEMQLLGKNTPMQEYPCPFDDDGKRMCTKGNRCKFKCMFMAY